jgi:predicted metal-dependent phosphoesterase TrpH
MTEHCVTAPLQIAGDGNSVFGMYYHQNVTASLQIAGHGNDKETQRKLDLVTASLQIAGHGNRYRYIQLKQKENTCSMHLRKRRKSASGG